MRAAMVAALLAATASGAVSISGGPQVSVARQQVTITWTTDVSSSTEVHFGLRSAASALAYDRHSVFSGLAGTSHSRTLRHLAAGTYYFRVRSADGVGQPGESAEASFVVPQGPLLPQAAVEGEVWEAEWFGNTLYVAGAFSRVFPTPVGGLHAVDEITLGQVDPDVPRVDGAVHAFAIDAAGNLIIGGDFTHVGGLPRGGLARLLRDGGVDPLFRFDVNGSVRALARVAGAVFVGGNFTVIGGVARNGLAGIETSLLYVLGTFDPNPQGTGQVNALWAATPNLYVGGNFTTIAGGSRADVALVVGNTGQLVTGFDAALSGTVEVYDLKLVGSTLYLAGDFTTVGGQARRSLAAVDAATGALSAGFAPSPNGVVGSIAATSTDVFACGTFTTIGGASRNWVAQLDASTGAARPWNPNLDDACDGAWLFGNRLHLTGDFAAAAGQPRFRHAVFDTGGLTLQPAHVPTLEHAHALVATGGRLWFGGHLIAEGQPLPRGNGLAIDGTTGRLLPWNPATNDVVDELAMANNRLFIGGNFLTVGAASQRGLAEVHPLTGAHVPFAFSANDLLWALTAVGNTLYAGVDFTQLGGSARTRFGAIDLSSNTLLPISPAFTGGELEDFAAVGNTLYVVGNFTNVAGQARQRAAALDATTGGVLPFNPSATGGYGAFAVVHRSPRVVVGGDFTTVGGTARPFLAAVDESTGALDGWAPAPDGLVHEVRMRPDGTLYVGGEFTRLAGQSRTALAQYDSALALTSLNQDIRMYENGVTKVFAVTINCGLGRTAFAGFFHEVSGSPAGSLAWMGESCPGTSRPSIQDNQGGDFVWRSSDTGTYAVGFTDGSALASFGVAAYSKQLAQGAELLAWTQVSTLSGTSSSASWALPAGTFAALPEGESHFAVRVFNAAGATSGLVDAFFVRKDTAPPSQPQNLAFTSATPPTLDFTPSTDATSGVAFYRVERAPSGSGSWGLAVSDGTLTAPPYVEGQSLSGSFDYRLQAVDQAGNASVVSATATVTAGASDGGPSDAGVPDAGEPDAGVPDGGEPDAGTPDGGAVDGGLGDGGVSDAGVPDGGEPDAGSTGSTDGGSPDGGGPSNGSDGGTLEPRFFRVGCSAAPEATFWALGALLLAGCRRRRARVPGAGAEVRPRPRR